MRSAAGYRACAALCCSALFGCATTSGSAWVREPEAGLHSAESAVAAAELSPGGFDLKVHGAREATGEARPRLQQTVSLGETAAEAPRAVAVAAPAAAAALAPPTTVVVHQYVTTISPGYASSSVPFVAAGPHRHFSARRVEPAARRASPTPAPGQDWPSPRMVGPAFPYRTAPASPWRGAR